MHLIVRRSARPHSRAVSATEFFLRGLNHRILGFGHRVNWQGSSDISTLDWRRVCVNNTVSAGLGRGAGQGQCQGLWSSRVDRCAHEHTCACTPTHTHTWALPEAYDAPKAFPAFSPVLFSPQKWLQDSEALLLLEGWGGRHEAICPDLQSSHPALPGPPHGRRSLQTRAQMHTDTLESRALTPLPSHPAHRLTRTLARRTHARSPPGHRNFLPPPPRPAPSLETSAVALKA